MPDPNTYCNAEVQYIMLIIRSLAVNKNRRDLVTAAEVNQLITRINNQEPFMLSSVGRKKVLETVLSFWNDGPNFGSVFTSIEV